MLANPFASAPSQGTGMFGAANTNQQAPAPTQQTNAVQQQPNTNQNFNGGPNNNQQPQNNNNQTPQLGPDGKPIAQTTGEEDDSILKLDGLWENETNADGTPKQPANDDGYLPKVDPGKFKEALSKLDFTKNITPEITAAINAGGDGAWPAVQQMLNSSLREVVAMNFSTAQKLFESGIGTAKDRFNKDVDGRVKSVMVDNALTSSNPIMRDPAFTPIVDAIKTQFQTKYPKATPAQIEAGVNNYFNSAVDKITASRNKKNEVTEDNTTLLKTGSPDAEWDEWIGMKG